MSKIAMKTPLVEMDGDEMTRVVWKQIKDIVILPFVDLKTVDSQCGAGAVRYIPAVFGTDYNRMKS